MKLYILLFGLAFGLVLADKPEAAPLTSSVEQKNKAAPIPSASASGSLSKALSAAVSTASKSNNKNGKSGYGYAGGYNSGYSGGYSGVNTGYNGVNTGYNGVPAGNGYNGAGAVQTVLNFHPQNSGYAGGYNGYATGSTGPTTTLDPAATTASPTTASYSQKPVNYVIYIQPQAVNGQYGKPTYGGPQTYGSNLNNYGTGHNSYAQNQVYGHNSLYSPNGASLGYGVQANYAPAYSGAHTGSYTGNAAYNTVQRPYNAPVSNYGASNVYPNQNYVQTPAVYPSVAGYPTVQVASSSYHGSASSYGRPQVSYQKPQSIYVSTYTQPQIYVKPGGYVKPVVTSTYGKPLTYLSASSGHGAAYGGYGKTSAAIALQAAISSYNKPALSVAKPEANPELYLTVDDDYKKKAYHQ